MIQLLKLVIISTSVVFAFLGCRKDIPVWNKKIFVGSSKEKALVRKQSDEAITCDSADFDQYIAIKKEDFDCLVLTYIINAKGWKKQSQCGLQP